ncbi:SDR family NAD(P)-dependent oxidoreductase [Maricaulis alexandrii]|uniref:SDR family NAD(P)-dependent oxidoreductase n=1 Tax=Maricaulis alexandrii TaxID=2570354 RepID=UPI0011085139|nr:SDR family NAD(P)-dependent oxidoreductase [Maricaulis alexandrii]
MTQPLQGRVAAVTGASSGLGRRFALQLSQAGAAVALLARRTDRLESLVSDIEAAGGRAIAVPLDVMDTAAIGPALETVEAELGPLSIMVNNAGVGGDGMALDMSEAHFDQTFAVNVRGVYFGAREAARLMLANGSAEAGQARIINIASIAAFTQLPGLTAYCASKAAVVSMTKGLAREWARHLIAVNAICPGYIETEINADWFATEGGKKQISKFPRRRLMDEDALDAALMMLAGDAGRQITGSAFQIDDGQIL